RLTKARLHALVNLKNTVMDGAAGMYPPNGGLRHIDLQSGRELNLDQKLDKGQFLAARVAYVDTLIADIDQTIGVLTDVSPVPAKTKSALVSQQEGLARALAKHPNELVLV